MRANELLSVNEEKLTHTPTSCRKSVVSKVIFITKNSMLKCTELTM